MKKKENIVFFSKLSRKVANYFFIFFCANACAINAKDLDKGKELFEVNCNVCHIRGKNIIIPEKNLQKATLEMNGIWSKDAIIYQITNGKNGMPAFGGRLTKDEISEIASYVLMQFN